MKRIIKTILLVILTTMASANTSAFEMEGWPGEGIPAFSAKKTSLTLYSDASKQSKPTQATFTKGARVSFDQSKVVTLQPAALKVKRRIFDCQCGDKQVELAVGDTVDYLQYRSEGYGIIAYKGNICEVLLSEDAFEGLENNPQTEWWIRVIDSQHKPIGWLLVDESDLTFLERQF